MAWAIRGAVLWVPLLATLAMLVTCRSTPPPAPARILIRVTTTRGAPVSGAEILLGSDVVASSDAAGLAQLSVGGREGDQFECEVRCPAPLRSPANRLVVRRLAIAGGDAEYAAKCEETKRTLVVLIRAENGPNLAITHLGTVLGYTDQSGAGHVEFITDVKESVEVTLVQKDLTIHPQDPSMIFGPSANDEVKEFAITFTRDAKRTPPPPKKKTIQVF